MECPFLHQKDLKNKIYHLGLVNINYLKKEQKLQALVNLVGSYLIKIPYKQICSIDFILIRIKIQKRDRHNQLNLKEALLLVVKYKDFHYCKNNLKFNQLNLKRDQKLNKLYKKD